MKGRIPKPFEKIGPLFETALHWEVKDPCIVRDETLWRLYGSGISKDGSGLRVSYATAPHMTGPWQERPGANLSVVRSPHTAAPGVVFDADDRHFHMAIQEDFTSIGGSIEYFASQDGVDFSFVTTLLDPIGHSGESGLYDPHFSSIAGKKCLAYAGMPGLVSRARPFIPQPDIYLAESESGLWAGPWKRLGKILDHDEVSWHHNKRDHPDYEWGIEGPQLVELPSGKILLNATCFLEGLPRGRSQRIFFAVADSILGPYKTIGPVLEPEPGAWDSGENGHATVSVDAGVIYLFYQARSFDEATGTRGRWKYGLALYKLADLPLA